MSSIAPANPFPVDVFPKEIQEIILATHENLGYPIDFIAAAILYAASVAIGNTHKVYVKEGFVESAVLYLAIVGRAGTNKTQPIKFALSPVRQQDQASYAVFKDQLAEYNRFASISRKERAQQGAEVPEKPVWPKTILSDFTLEALVEVHKANLRGIGVYSDELASWFKNFTRYNQGSEMEFWLSSWSGTDVSKDRVSGEPTLLSMPFISVIGSIQPSVLYDLAKDTRSQNGFMDRILFVDPDDLQKQPWSDTDLPTWVTHKWHKFMSNLLERPLHLNSNGAPQPTILHFTPEARQELFNWQNNITAACNASGDETMASIYSKLETYAPRLALILQMLFYATAEGEKDAVSIKAVQGAIKLAEYFAHCALKIRTRVSEPQPLARLATNKRKFYDSLQETFTTSEALDAGTAHGFSESTVKQFLRERSLFERMNQGQYRKLF